jgi:hypothetical protein
MQAAKEWEEFQTNPMTVGMLVPLKMPALPEKRSKEETDGCFRLVFFQRYHRAEEEGEGRNSSGCRGHRNCQDRQGS